MNAELVKYIFAILASTGTAYTAIRTDLVELKVTSSYLAIRLDKVERALEK
jgi:hypothetical protein